MPDDETTKDSQTGADELSELEPADDDLAPANTRPVARTAAPPSDPEPEVEWVVEDPEPVAEGDPTGAIESGAAGEPTDVTPVDVPEPPTVPLEATPRRAERSPLVPILAVTTAVLFVATVLFGLMAFAPRFAPIRSGPAKLALRAQEEDGLEKIAKRFAVNFVSLSYKTIDDDLDEMTADATSTFGTQLRETIERIQSAFKKSKASSTGEALDAAVLSQSEDSAIVQVLLRRTKTNVGTKGPQTGNQVVNVTLVKTDDGWKVNDLSQLGAQSAP